MASAAVMAVANHQNAEHLPVSQIARMAEDALGRKEWEDAAVLFALAMRKCGHLHTLAITNEMKSHNDKTKR